MARTEKNMRGVNDDRAHTPTRTNDLYCRDMPSAKAIEEIKRLAAIRGVKVGRIVHGEHQVVMALREALVTTPGTWAPSQIEALLKKNGIPTGPPL